MTARRCGLSLLVGLAILAGISRAEENASPIGRRIEAFELRDHLGARRSWQDFRDSRAVVIVFLGTQCPLAKLYGPRLQELAERYESKGVQFVGVNSNGHDTLQEIAHYVRTHGIEFPMLKDAGAKVADQFGAERTPEAFLLDQRRVVRYRGRIDDQYGVGYSRAKATREDLAGALDELLAGEPISQPETEAVGCFISRPGRRPPRGEITYAKDISRIVARHCVRCHRPGQIAPFSLTRYEDVAAWAETIREVVKQGRMPPWHADPRYGKFANDARMSDEEKSLLYRWVNNGCPSGDEAQLPEPPEFPEGWSIPEPDLVVRMPEECQVPAKGVVPYQYFYVDPKLEEDKWVRAAEGRPGNASVVHHLVLFYVPPEQERFRPEDPLFKVVAAFAPGMPPIVSPRDGLARRIPAGSKLVFQMHYTPNGSPQTDISEAGLVFADPDEVEKEVTVGAAFNWRFLIPPGAPNHRVEASHTFVGGDWLIYGMLPHMHLRGKSFRFTLEGPGDGPRDREEILLEVPQYDFNWQNNYVLAKPKLAPDGSKMRCVAHFDNSAHNLVNPDPTQAVHWGDQTWEEMMVGSFFMSPAEQDLRLGPPRVGPKEGDRYPVRFRYRPKQPCEDVYLAGSFNDWKPDGHAMDGPDKDGWFHASVQLPAGRHEYKFVLDGKTWKSDPGNRQRSRVYGNSVLELAP